VLQHGAINHSFARNRVYRPVYCLQLKFSSAGPLQQRILHFAIFRYCQAPPGMGWREVQVCFALLGEFDLVGCQTASVWSRFSHNTQQRSSASPDVATAAAAAAAPPLLPCSLLATGKRCISSAQLK